MTAATDLQVDAALAREAARLAERFRGVFSRQAVERQLFDSYLEIERGARLRTHLLETDLEPCAPSATTSTSASAN
jgi:hypothetical protein